MNKKPPKILTPKDCLYVEDIMNVTAVLSKKSSYYSNIIDTKKIKTMLRTIERKLNDQFNALLEVIKE